MSAGAPKKIMLASDLTPAGDRAFDRAVQLAAQWNAELTVCHVIESTAIRPWGMERRVRNAETELDRLVRAAKLGRPVPRHIVVGDPAERTLEHAARIGCDFLVTGPAHGKMLGEKLLGSTAARMVRSARQPVLAVRHRPEGAYGTIAATVDFSEASRAALEAARALFPSAHITALHCYRVSPNWTGPDADKPASEVEEAERARVRQRAEADMADVIKAAGGAGARIEARLIEGEPEAAIADYVGGNWPDLVVTGTHGASGHKAGAIGSTTEHLLMVLPCDVLAIPGRA